MITASSSDAAEYVQKFERATNIFVRTIEYMYIEWARTTVGGLSPFSLFRKRDFTTRTSESEPQGPKRFTRFVWRTVAYYLSIADSYCKIGTARKLEIAKEQEAHSRERPRATAKKSPKTT